MQSFHNLFPIKGTFQENFPVGACSMIKLHKQESSFAKVPLSVSVYDNIASTNNFSWKLLLEDDQQETVAIQ